ncbi:MAG TPA: hypothetical protein VGM64_20920 [Lacunisphaera sp.]|jgi:hypothetical protein
MNNDGLNALKQANFATGEFSEIVRLVNLTFSGIRLAGSLVEPPAVLCRARSDLSPFQHRDQISYKRSGIDIGRCNTDGQSLFYAANSLLPLPNEIKAKSGEVLTVGYWRSTKKLLFQRFGFSEDVREKLGTRLRSHPTQEVPTPDQKDTHHYDRYNYLMDAFTKMISESELHYYKLTAAIATILLGEIETESFRKFIPQDIFDRTCFDGLMYPSIPSLGNFRSYAIRPNIIDSCFELFRVETFQIEAMEGCPDFLVPLRTGFPRPDGTIAWTNRFETQYEVQLATEKVRVSHEDLGFRIIDSQGKDSLGF